MTDEPEIKGTEIDRAAARILISAATGSIENCDDAGQLEAAWRSAAALLAVMDDDGFNQALDRIEARRESAGVAVMARVDDLTTHLVDWRHASWEAAEIAAGRDPHQVA